MIKALVFLRGENFTMGRIDFEAGVLTIYNDSVRG